MSWLCAENKFGDTALGSPEPCVNVYMCVTGLLQLIRFYRPAVYNIHCRQKGDDTACGDQSLPLALRGVRAELSTVLSTEH